MNELILRPLKTVSGDVPIGQRAHDQYVNATQLCEAAEKQFHDWRRLKQTEDYLNAMISVTGIPVSELIQSVRGGNPEMQGTWVHPRVAMRLAQWLAPEFAVQVDGWLIEGMNAPPLTQDELILAIAQRNVEMARDVEKLKDDVKRLEANLDTDHGYLTLLAFCKGYGLPTDRGILQRHGIALSKICRNRGIEIGKIRNAEHFTHNTYPEWLLREYFDIVG